MHIDVIRKISSLSWKKIYTCITIGIFICQAYSANLKILLPFEDTRGLPNGAYQIEVYKNEKEVYTGPGNYLLLKPGMYRIKVVLSSLQQVDTIIQLKNKDIQLDLRNHPAFQNQPEAFLKSLADTDTLRLLFFQFQHVDFDKPSEYRGWLTYHTSDSLFHGKAIQLYTDKEIDLEISRPVLHALISYSQITENNLGIWAFHNIVFITPTCKNISWIYI